MQLLMNISARHHRRPAVGGGQANATIIELL